MGRQLFLHHYLPAHLASALVTGSLLEFIFFAEPNPDESNSKSDAKGPKRKNHQSSVSVDQSGELITAGTRLQNQNLLPLWGATGVILGLVIFGWYWFSPLTYGQPGLDVAGVMARKWLSYDLHFAK